MILFNERNDTDSLILSNRVGCHLFSLRMGLKKR